jgi:hypothetical protein
LRRTSAIILLSISVVAMLLLPACTFRLDEPQQLTLAQDLQIGTISEGYLLSKDPTFATNDRDYMENDVLYVWVWSSSFDYANMDDFYCELSSGGLEHKIFINPDQNMSQPNSYTGSFNLSRLEKTGDWTVQIYLRTSPPKPVTFDETDVIHVSALPPTTHELSVSSSPVTGIAFTLNGTNRTTFFSSVINQGSYTIAMPSKVTVNGKTYNFVEWENRLTNPTRTVELTDDKLVTAYFEAVQPVENLTSTIKGIVTDNLGNPITDAKVTIVETEEFTFTVSEPAGQYTFGNVTQGTYTLKVEAAGYNTTLTAVGVEPDKATTQNFSLTPSTTEEPQPEPDNGLEVLQIGLVLLAAIGGAALLLLWRSRKRAMKTIKKTEYKKSLEKVRLKAELEELDNLLQKGLLTKEEHEKLRRQTEEELSKISDKQS